MKKKILIIDDDPTTISLLENGLDEAGYEIVIARDGDVGLERAEKESPDLILMDVNMPRLNGYMMLLEIKKIDALRDTPVIVLSAHEETKPMFERKGVQCFLNKPVDLGRIKSSIETLLPE